MNGSASGCQLGLGGGMMGVAVSWSRGPLMDGEKSSTPEEIREELERIRYLRTIVDLTASVIMQSRLSRAEAERLVEATRRRILELFPGKEQTYDIIYRPRFERLISEFVEDAPVQSYRER